MPRLTPTASLDRPRYAADGIEVGIRELIAVREIVHAFLTADRPADVFQFALDRVSPLAGATFACVYLVDGASELMKLGAAFNWPERFAPFLGDMRVRVGFGPSGEAASERRVIEVPDVFSDPSLEDWQEVANEMGFRSIVALPLQSGQLVLGTVTFYFADAGALSTETRNLLRMVADQMAATAEKARLIDDLRRANAALLETNSELEKQYASSLEARRIKDEFLANISHELRTPLTAVMGYISLMQEGMAGPVTDEQQHTLTQVKGASEHLLALIGDLLDLTTLKKGELEVEACRFDAREPLREATGAMRQLLPAGVGLVVNEAADPALMYGDKRKVTKILSSLLSNACKFTHAGEVRVSMHVDGDRVLYSVDDTGIGIAPDAQKYVFDEFRQADGSTTRKYGGSGLGLALAHRLAQLLGGDILLVSQPGVGSSFRVELPLVYAPH